MSGAHDAAADAALMRAYVRGDQKSFATLYRHHAPKLRGFLRTRGVTPAEADDILQQTFLKLHRHRAVYQSGRELRPWLYTIARNALRDYLRRRAIAHVAVADLDGLAAEMPAMSDRLDARRVLGRVAPALAHLRPGQREALDLHWQGPDAQRAATVRGGLSASTLRVRAHRAQAALRRLVETG